MREWRGTLIQSLLIVCLTVLAIKSSDQFVLHSVVGIFGASVGHAMSRARQDGGKGGGGGFSMPPIAGAGLGAILAIAFSLLTEKVAFAYLLHP